MTDSENMPDLPNLDFEKNLWKKDITLVAGIDEAGRGAWAGPVTAAAVILPSDPKVLHTLYGVRDSKQMTAHQRDYWKHVIREVSLRWAIGWGTVEEIDRLGILNATRLAMKRAVRGLKLIPDHLLIDAVQIKSLDIPQTSLIKGDVRVLSISAASVLAKTARDERMIHLDRSFPSYGFARHKGYGTALHREALIQFGPCEIHRFSFAPIKLSHLEKTRLPLLASSQKTLELSS
jgi:ribonuclease HII